MGGMLAGATTCIMLRCAYFGRGRDADKSFFLVHGGAWMMDGWRCAMCFCLSCSEHWISGDAYGLSWSLEYLMS